MAQLRDSAGKTLRDAEHRAQGIQARTKAAFDTTPVPDEILVERLRAKMGRVVSHPRPVKIAVQDGRVSLSGQILEKEAGELLRLVHGERGVVSVENRLDVYESPEDLPRLQGGAARPGIRPDFLQESWAPTTRLLAGVAGSALLVAGAAARSVMGVAGGLGGAALLARAVANLPYRRLLGYGAGTRAVDVEKTLTVDAPIQDVFAYWANPENYPRFMHHVLAAKAIGEGRYHLTVEGPGGLPFELQAVMTDFVPEIRLGWETLQGSPIGTAGRVRFLRNPDNSTRIDVRMSYNPPLGALGHAIASLAGADPVRILGEDMARFKSLLELGKTHIRGQVVTVEELSPTIARTWEGMEQTH